MSDRFIGALDQGTTSTRFFLFNRQGGVVAFEQIEHEQIYPQSGWVEHVPEEIWGNTCHVIKQVFDRTGISPAQCIAIGVTNQRETIVCWDPDSGKSLSPAIVWQDTRTDGICKRLAEKGGQDRFRNLTGLPISTYFSAPKMTWLLENVKHLRQRTEKGGALFGTVDSWLVWNLTGGRRKKGAVHVTDVTNASRTLLFDINDLKWHDGLIDTFGIPSVSLPEIRPSIGPDSFGHTDGEGPFGCEIPITGILGDQQAALFGQCCHEEGDTKNTYGTGCFMLTHTGSRPVTSRHGLLTTVAYQIGDTEVSYALEGSIAITGALVQWLRDNMGIIESSEEVEILARKVPDSGGLYFVPAFSGLFAPYWRANARGLIIGMTHGTNRYHLARATLEATAYQTLEIFEAMEKDMGRAITSLQVDGGMVVNELLMQFQADILGCPVIKPAVSETTALGACFAAGLGVGFWDNKDVLKNLRRIDRTWTGSMPAEERSRRQRNWQRAVQRTFDWLEN